MKTAWLLLGIFVGYIMWYINPTFVIAASVVRWSLLALHKYGFFRID